MAVQRVRQPDGSIEVIQVKDTGYTMSTSSVSGRKDSPMQRQKPACDNCKKNLTRRV